MSNPFLSVRFAFLLCLALLGATAPAAEKKSTNTNLVEFPFAPLPAGAAYANPALAPATRAAAVVQALSLEEKLTMVAGYNSFYAPGSARLGLRPLYFSDASQGVHIRPKLNTGLDKSTAFPCTLALAATWDPSLAGDYAKAIGEECRAGDIAVLLGPGMNIYRSSQNGRNFEYLGEDPFLAGVMVDSYVRGVQSVGVMATLKHFVCNNDEHRRHTCDSVVDERAMHEIYTPAFRRGIAAGAGAVMTSYNLVNGEWAGQNRQIITGLLREEFGFHGMVMTDWGSINDVAKFLKSGNDLCMPGRPAREIKAVLDQGGATEADLDRMITTWLAACFQMGFYDRPQRDAAQLTNYAAHAAVALQTSRESIVLLKNDHQLLPLPPVFKGKILLVGKAAQWPMRGGGSGEVDGYDTVPLLKALRKEYGDRLHFTLEPTDEDIKQAAYVIVTVATLDAEEKDRPFAVLPAWGGDLPARCGALNPHTIVVGLTGGGFRMTGFQAQVGAIVLALFGGQSQGEAIVDTLMGRLNPGGRLPFTIEKEFADSPGCVYGPMDLPVSEEQKRHGAKNCATTYQEGVFVGYRWYEHKQIQPLYPFGYGLSYTTFQYGQPQLSTNTLNQAGQLKVSFVVTNTGEVAGVDVPQLYIQAQNPTVERPVKELKGFQRVFLAPHAQTKVELSILPADLAYWDSTRHGWQVAPGQYQIRIGASSADLKLNLPFEYQ